MWKRARFAASKGKLHSECLATLSLAARRPTGSGAFPLIHRMTKPLIQENISAMAASMFSFLDDTALYGEGRSQHPKTPLSAGAGQMAPPMRPASSQDMQPASAPEIAKPATPPLPPAPPLPRRTRPQPSNGFAASTHIERRKAHGSDGAATAECARRLPESATSSTVGLQLACFRIRRFHFSRHTVIFHKGGGRNAEHARGRQHHANHASQQLAAIAVGHAFSRGPSSSVLHGRHK